MELQIHIPPAVTCKLSLMCKIQSLSIKLCEAEVVFNLITSCNLKVKISSPQSITLTWHKLLKKNKSQRTCMHTYFDHANVAKGFYCKEEMEWNTKLFLFFLDALEGSIVRSFQLASRCCSSVTSVQKPVTRASFQFHLYWIQPWNINSLCPLRSS